MSALSIVALVILASGEGAAQTRFEVASIRTAVAQTSTPEGSQRSRIEYTPTTLTMENVDLADCVQWAYQLRFPQFRCPLVCRRAL